MFVIARREATANFLTMLKVEKGVALNTIEAYRADLEAVQCGIGCALETATHDALCAYFNSLTLHPRSVARRMSTLRQYYKYLMREGTIGTNPMHDTISPRWIPNLPKILSEEEVDRLLETASGVVRVMLEVLYATGMRVSELVALPRCSLVDGMLLVKGKGGKERLIPIHHKAWGLLQQQIDLRSPWLFPSSQTKSHVTRQHFAQKLKQTAMAANIDPDKISPHVIRHAFATHLLKNGAHLMLIKELLGHANLSTSEIYLSVLPEDLKALILKHHPLAKGMICA